MSRRCSLSIFGLSVKKSSLIGQQLFKFCQGVTTLYGSEPWPCCCTLQVSVCCVYRQNVFSLQFECNSSYNLQLVIKYQNIMMMCSHVFVYVLVCLYPCLFIALFISLFVYILVSLYPCLFISLFFIPLSVYILVCLYPYLFISLFISFSTGTGRTGTMLAIDLCMQAYDDSQTVDIMNCIYRLRNDRAGAVHTTAHYAFIYKVRISCLLDMDTVVAATSCRVFVLRKEFDSLDGFFSNEVDLVKTF